MSVPMISPPNAARPSPLRVVPAALTSQPSPAVLDRCRAILALLLPHRRAADTTVGDRPDHFPDQLHQLAPAVDRGEPVVLTLPGFPCKSPNPDKVLGRLPDHGERLALRFLDGLAAAVERVHPPGARILVCSDGHVFGDLIGVDDADVDAYGDALRAMARAEGLARIGYFDLRDVYGDPPSTRKRELLHDEFAPTVEELRAQVRADEDTVTLYRGITRFLVEDTVGFTGTRSALQRQCRERAYGVIQRSRAWGDLVDREYPHAMRLSIHPQRRGTTKLGIRLLGAPDVWTTPWHSVVLLHRDGRCELMPHHRARIRGRLVEVGGCPDHYLADAEPGPGPGD